MNSHNSLRRYSSCFKRCLLALLLFASLDLCSAFAAAQDESPSPPEEKTERRRRRPRGAHVLQQLNLTSEQVAQVRRIREESEPARRTLAQRLRQAHRQLDAAIYNENADESVVEQRASELALAQAEVVRLRAFTELKVRRILTPQQLTTLRELRQQARRQTRYQRRENRRGFNRRDQRPRDTPPDEQ